MRRAAITVACLLTGALVTACGGAVPARAPAHGAVRPAARHARPVPAPSRPVPSPARPARPGAPAAAVAVVTGWANALRRGDVAAAARYFALPSVFANGTDGQGRLLAARITTEQQARVANESLPCGAKVVRVTLRGPYLDALFMLTGRPGPGGTNCGGVAGVSARTFFVIRGGKIEHWLRAPPEPGDPGTAHGPGPQPVPPVTQTPSAGVPA